MDRPCPLGLSAVRAGRESIQEDDAVVLGDQRARVRGQSVPQHLQAVLLPSVHQEEQLLSRPLHQRHARKSNLVPTHHSRVTLQEQAKNAKQIGQIRAGRLQSAQIGGE